jgi:hypothetical protein
MSNLKTTPDLFLEVQEIGRLKKFLDDDGFRQFLLLNAVSFGLVRNKIDNTFTNGYVSEGAALTLSHAELKAIDKNGKLIYRPASTGIAVPPDSIWRWVKVKYAISNEEKGTWSIDANGNLTCTSLDGELTKVLRGQPNFASVIRFNNTSNNTNKYEILEVVDDNNAKVQGYFSSESDLKLVVVGTFTPGSVPSSGDDDIFEYDSCALTLVQETTLNTVPTLITNEEFVLARVMSDGSTLSIEDKRDSFFETPADYNARHLFTSADKVCGVDKITHNFSLGPKDENLITVSWGLRSSSWSFNAKLNQITFSNIEGGRVKPADVSLLSNGDFDGWKVYTNTGKFYTVRSSLISGGQLIVTLNNADKNELDGTYEITLVPNVEEVEIVFTAHPADLTPNADRRFVFPVQSSYGVCPVPVYKATNAKFILQYRFKNLKNYSPLRLVSSDAIGYYNENQYTGNGIIIGSPIRTAYIASASNGFITLVLNGDAYSLFQSRVDTGDLFGVQDLILANGSPVKQLYCKSHYQYQHNDQGSFTLSTNIFINLNKTLIDNVTPIRNGNSFVIHLNSEFDLTSTPYHLRIVTDYVDSLTYTLLKEITQDDIDFINQSARGMYLLFTFDGTNWVVGILNDIDPYSEWATQSYSALSLDATSGTWTIPSSPTTNFKIRYKKVGKTVHYNFSISNSSISSTPASLRLKLPTGMVIKTSGTFQWNAIGLYANGNDIPASGPIRIEANAGDSELFLSKLSGSHVVITGGFEIRGQITFEID